MADIRPPYGFPAAVGNLKLGMVVHVGPANYTVVTFSNPGTSGGDVMTSGEAGLGSMSFAIGGVTDSGNFTVKAIPINPSIPPASVEGPSYRLQWIANLAGSIGGKTQVAGAEAVAATNLSGEIVRFPALGCK